MDPNTVCSMKIFINEQKKGAETPILSKTDHLFDFADFHIQGAFHFINHRGNDSGV